MRTSYHHLMAIWIAASSLVIAGCGNSALLQRKEREIESLRSVVDQVRDEHGETREKVFALRQQVIQIEGERSNAQHELDQLRSAQEAKDSENERLVKEKVRLEGKLVEWQRSYENLKRKLSAVQTEATRTAEELADLRLKTSDVDERATSYERALRQLRDENRRLAEMLDTTQVDLKKARAVVRSFETLEPDQQEFAEARQRAAELEGQVGSLRQQVANLEAATDELRQSKLDVLKKHQKLLSELPPSVVQQLGVEATVEGGAALACSGKGLYHSDPGGLWQEVVGLVRGRYEGFVERRAVWDGLDIGLVVGTVLFIFALVWLALTPVRWLRRRRMARELVELRARTAQLDARMEASSGGATPRAASSRRQHVVRRGGHFSAIIDHESEESESLQGLESVEAAAPVEVQEEAYEVPEAALQALDEPDLEPRAEAPVSARPGQPGRGRQVIGARQWESAGYEDEGTDEYEDDGEFGNTQVIAPISELEIGVGVGVGVGGPQGDESRRPRVARVEPTHVMGPSSMEPRDEEELDDDEFGNTQVIAPLPELELREERSVSDSASPEVDSKKARPSAEKEKDAGEAARSDLLSELEDIIGQKVDEIL